MAFTYHYMIEEREHSFKEIDVLNSTEKIHYPAGPIQVVDKDSGLNIDAIFLFTFRTWRFSMRTHVNSGESHSTLCEYCRVTPQYI